MADKTYTIDEIKQIAPRYKGKPENFKPGFKRPKAESKPRTNVLPAPTHINIGSKPTEQRNESIISESIFGVDITVTEIAPKQSFATNLSKIQDLTLDIFDAYRVDEPTLDRKLCKEELLYYSTGLTVMKILEVKAKQEDNQRRKEYP